MFPSLEELSKNGPPTEKWFKGLRELNAEARELGIGKDRMDGMLEILERDGCIGLAFPVEKKGQKKLWGRREVVEAYLAGPKKGR